MDILKQQVLDKEKIGIKWPLPPAELQSRVVGGYYSDFVKSGYDHAKLILDYLNPHVGASLLDFGCGCARVSLSLKTLRPDVSIHGVDADIDAIEHNKINYSDLGEFYLNKNTQISLEDNSIDYCWMISVFTHLPEDMNLAYLKEIKRILKPGGKLLITLMGYEYFNLENFLTEHEKVKIRQDGTLYSKISPVYEIDKLPEYKNSFHTPEYIFREYSKTMNVIQFKQAGLINSHQDLYILQKSN